MAINDENRDDIVLLAAGNKLGYAKTDRTLGSCHAYFYITGATQAREFVLNVDDDATGIIVTTDFTDYTDKAGAWYSLDGRKLQGQPTKAGVYINNGKKVVVK